MRHGDWRSAIAAFRRAARGNPNDPRTADHLLLALHADGQKAAARRMAQKRIEHDPTALVPRALLALNGDSSLSQFSTHARHFVGEDEYVILGASLVFAELGLVDEAYRIVKAACVDAVPGAERGFMPLYYLAWYASLRGETEAARRWLVQASETRREGVFASRPIEEVILQYAVSQNTEDGHARLQWGCLLADLGRTDEAVSQWRAAVRINAGLSIAWRNLGLTAAARGNLAEAASLYRTAMEARPSDQTLYRDLAEILIADQQRGEAIRVMETMPCEGLRRAEITVLLAECYVGEKRYADCIQLLESTPYFVNWEGQDITWRLFNQAHVQRGKQRFDDGAYEDALQDFEAALTYPKNLNVGRSNKPREAPAEYWRGRALAALGRLDEARSAWQKGASGADVQGDQNEYRRKCRQALAGETE
jgi:tetratricopeptide (TPR) repeat protein